MISLERQQFLVPDRQDSTAVYLCPIIMGPEQQRTTGYTEASRGCKHLCRHCPIVPVYAGRFRIVQRDVVLEDIRQQVAVGAEHMTFGDPDFFNGIGHAVPLAQALHAAFPHLTYDVTIKIEHLLRYAEHLPTLKRQAKKHQRGGSRPGPHPAPAGQRGTRQDFFDALALCQQVGLNLNPTFVAFTPWTTLDDYIELLTVLATQDLIAHVAPIQLAMRLLLPAGSTLLALPEMRPFPGL